MLMFRPLLLGLLAFKVGSSIRLLSSLTIPKSGVRHWSARAPPIQRIGVIRNLANKPFLEKSSDDMKTIDSLSIRDHLDLAKIRSKRIVIEEKEDLIKNKPTSKENFAIIWRIMKLGKRDLKYFLYAIFFIMIAVLYPTVLVRLVGSSIDSYNANNIDEDGDLLIWGYKYTNVFMAMIPFMIGSTACFWARGWILKVLGERLVARLRFRVMKNLLRHDSAFYDNDKNKVGDLISRLSSDAYVVSRSITGSLPEGLRHFLFGISSSYMMFAINPILFGILMVISPLITTASLKFGKIIRNLSIQLQNAAAGLTKVSEETLNSVKLVKAFTGEQNELRKYGVQIRQTVNVARQEALAQANYNTSIYTLYHTGYLACITLGLYFILSGRMTTGDVVAFSMYAEIFNISLFSLTNTYMELMKGAGAGVKLFLLIDHKNLVDPIRGEKVPKALEGGFEFNDVNFTYPTRPNNAIFTGCTFKVESGSSTCFVAPSGCGKSTIAALLLRSYNINDGSIKIGNKDITDFQIRELRRNVIGVVQQEPILLSGTIVENIVYGLTGSEIDQITMEDVYKVCKQANCHDFIMAFPEGYDTYIGSKGASLSGGQKQRIAIARALIKKPLILILDEATSALDSKSEALINDTLKKLTSEGKMTIISIAHRLSTISKSENIVVLGKGGKVIETGKFVDLYADNESELSMLLDESNSKKEYTKLTDEQIEEQEKLNHEAKELEQSQYNSDLDQLRALIDDLSPELRKELLDQISQNRENHAITTELGKDNKS